MSLGLAESDLDMPKEVKEAIELIEAAKEKLHKFNRIPNDFQVEVVEVMVPEGWYLELRRSGMC